MTRHAIEVRGSVTCAALHRDRALVARPAYDGRLVQPHSVALPRRCVDRVAIEAARARDHLARLLEEGRGPLALVRDAIEAGWGRKRLGRETSAGGQEHKNRRDADEVHAASERMKGR